MDKKDQKSLNKHLDDVMLKYSSSKLGLTDYSPDKTYDKEEKKFGIKELGITVGIMAAIIAIATTIAIATIIAFVLV